MKVTKPGPIMAVMMFCIFCAVSAGQAQQDTAKVLSIDPESKIRYAAPWTPSPMKYRNAQELVVMREARVQVEGRGPQSVTYPVARVLITTERRRSHADAVKRLEEIAA